MEAAEDIIVEIATIVEKDQAEIESV